MAQFAVSTFLLGIQRDYEAMKQAEIFVQRIRQCCHVICWITDDIQQQITTLSQITAQAHETKLFITHYLITATSVQSFLKTFTRFRL